MCRLKECFTINIMWGEDEKFFVHYDRQCRPLWIEVQKRDERDDGSKVRDGGRCWKFFPRARKTRKVREIVLERPVFDSITASDEFEEWLAK